MSKRAKKGFFRHGVNATSRLINHITSKPRIIIYLYLKEFTTNTAVWIKKVVHNIVSKVINTEI